jgi:dephospho-CoA kinase
MKKIGITGGIGSGKSFISEIIKAMGYPVFNSDMVAKDIMNNNVDTIKFIINNFGSSSYHNGTINKAYLAKQFFNNPEKLKIINNHIHPKVRDQFDDFCNVSNSDFIFNESAIIFETGIQERFDAVVLILSPKELRIKRIMDRDDVSLEDVTKRMDNQLSDEQKLPLTKFHINNDNESHLLIQIHDFMKNVIN